MPLMGSLYVGQSGLQTSQSALNTTGHNITNADTPGYVRQQTMLGDKNYNLLSINTTGIANKQTGLGVTYQQIRQVRDVFLDKTYREENGRLSFYETQYETTSELETLLGEFEGASFENSLNNLWVSIQELSKDPSSGVVQGLVMQKAYAFMSDAQAVYQGMCNYQDNLNMEIKNTVDTINDYGHRIYELNEQIRKIETGGFEHANDLQDERNRLLDELSSFAKVSYSTDPEGNVLVKLEDHVFVRPDRVSEMAVQVDETTSLYDVFWLDDAPFKLDPNGHKIYDTDAAPVFLPGETISAQLDTDLGKLKSMFLARGDHRANFTDMETIRDANGDIISTEAESYAAVSGSVIMKYQAEFDRLVHSVVTAINGALEEAYNEGDGVYMSNGHGGPLQIFQRKVSDDDVKEDYTKAETLFSVGNLSINRELLQTPGKLGYGDLSKPGFTRPDGSVDYTTAEKLKAVFDMAEYRLNPDSQTQLSINSFYAGMVGELANDGAVYKSNRDNEQITVDSTESARQQVIGVSTDEELESMIRYQNAYNASSRYINVVTEMLDHLLTSLG